MSSWRPPPPPAFPPPGSPPFPPPPGSPPGLGPPPHPSDPFGLPPSVQAGLASDVAGTAMTAAFLSLLLHGMFTIQFYTYITSKTYRKEPLWIKLTVLIEAGLATASSVVLAITAYDYAVKDITHPERLLILTPTFATVGYSLLVTPLPVYCFFAWRIKVLTKNNYIFALYVFLILVDLGVGFYSLSEAAIIGQFFQLTKIRYLILAWSFLATMPDLIVSLTLVWFLRTYRTGFPATDAALTKISRMLIQTGSIITLSMLIGGLVFSDQSTNLRAFIVAYPIPLVQAASLMSSLNARLVWKEAQSTNPTNDFNWSAASTVIRGVLGIVKKRRHQSPGVDEDNPAAS